MAKKSFVLSSGDGGVIFSNTDLVSIDDGITPGVAGHVSASNLYISSSFRISTFSNNITGTLLSSSGATSFATSSLVGTATLSGCVGWNGTNYVVTNILNPSDYGGTPLGTYISGNYQENSRLINISTVSSGTLKPAYGGTGLTGSQYASSKNLILYGSGSSPTSFSVLSASASGTIIVSGEGRFNVQFPSYKPDVRFYGSPGIYTWVRPIGARFARIVLQGAGGGGGGGASNPGANSYGGGGGGSGGFTDIVIDVSTLMSASVAVGQGGAGGAGVIGSTVGALDGIAGGSTYWSDQYTTYTSTGGGGGYRGNSTAVSTRGVGLTKNGGRGAAPVTSITAEVVYGVPSGGGKGAGGNNGAATSGGTIITLLNPANKNFGYNIDVDGESIDTSIISGTAGASLTISPANSGSYGSGGGGGAASTAAPGAKSNGGRGGDGFALIISW